MVGWKKSCLIMLVLLVAILTGCSKKNLSVHLFESDYIQMLVGEPTKVAEGDFQVVDGISYFVDYETAVGVPICNKPDCRHLPKFLNPGTTCNAALEYQRIVPYSGLLYGVKSNENDQKELFTSGFDGSNRKRIGKILSGSVAMDFVLVGSKLYYNTFVLSEESPKESGSDLLLVWSVYALDLDTLEMEEIITRTGIDYRILFLGGTKEYLIYQIQDDTGIGYYCLDYNTNQSERLPIEIAGRIIPYDQKCFYYTPETDGEESIHHYNLSKKEDQIYISKDEISKLMEDTKGGVGLEVSFGKGFVFGVYASDLANRSFYLKENEDAPIQKLMLPEQLEEKEDTYFDGFGSETKDGMLFSYQNRIEITKDEIDSTAWYGYIEKSALLDGLAETKTVIKPLISNLSNPVDSTGNIVY